MTDPRPGDAATSRLALLGWVAAFVLHRALVLALGFDGVFFWEESYRLLVAEALRKGWNIPLHDLQADPYSGGSLVISALAALASPVLGTSLMALKIVALAWNALGLGLWLLLADRVFGRRAAHGLGLLWLVAPPIFVVFNLVAQGFHSDTTTLAGLQLLLLYRYLEDPARRRSLLAAWAVVGGFSVWFAYVSVLPLAAGALFALVCGALPLRVWPLAAGAFVVGLSPWLILSLPSGQALDIVAVTFTDSRGDQPSLLASLFDLVARGIPAALYFRDIGIPGDVKIPRGYFAYPWLAVFGASWIGVAVSLRRRRGLAQCPELPVLLLFPLFVVVIAASNMEFNDLGTVRFFTFRLLSPALPAAFLTIALAGAILPRAGRVAMLSVCVLTGLAGSGQLLLDGSRQRSALEADARGLGAEAMGHLLVFKHGTSARIEERIDALPEGLRARAWQGAGFNLVCLYTRELREEDAAALGRRLRALGPEARGPAVAGARLALGPGIVQVAPVPESPRREELKAVVDSVAGQTAPR